MPKTDKRLIKREDNLDELWLENSSEIYAYILAYMRNEDDAQDILQSVAILVIRHYKQLRDIQKFKWWAIKIARNEIRAFYRKRPVSVQPWEQAELDRFYFTDGGMNEIEDNVAKDTVNEYMEELPSKWAKALYLQLYYREKAPFISKVIDETYSTTQKRLYRMRQELRQRLLAKGVKP